MESDTKQCPHCGKEIKAAAKKCRYCGEWLDENISPQPDQSSHTDEVEKSPREEITEALPTEEEEDDSQANRFVWPIAITLLLIGLICLLGTFNSGSSETVKMEEIPYEESTYDYTSPSEEPLEEEEAAIIIEDSGVCPYDGVPDEDDYSISSESTGVYDGMQCIKAVGLPGVKWYIYTWYGSPSGISIGLVLKYNGERFTTSAYALADEDGNVEYEGFTGAGLQYIGAVLKNMNYSSIGEDYPINMEKRYITSDVVCHDIGKPL